MKVMCLKVNPVNLLVKVHLVLSFAPVFSMVYPHINKINYSPFKRQTLQEWYLGQDVMNIERFSLVVKPKPKPKPIPFDSQVKTALSHKYSGKYRKLASERITYSFQVSSYHLLQSPRYSFSAPSHLSSAIQEGPTFCLNEYTQDSYKEPSIISCNTNVSICLCCSKQFTPIVYQGYSRSDTTAFKTLLK